DEKIGTAKLRLFIGRHRIMSRETRELRNHKIFQHKIQKFIQLPSSFLVFSFHKKVSSSEAARDTPSRYIFLNLPTGISNVTIIQYRYTTPADNKSNKKKRRQLESYSREIISIRTTWNVLIGHLRSPRVELRLFRLPFEDSEQVFVI